MFKTALCYGNSCLKRLIIYYSKFLKFVKCIFGVHDAIRTSIDCLPMIAFKESTIYLISERSKFAFHPPVTSYRSLSYANYRAPFVTSNLFLSNGIIFRGSFCSSITFKYTKRTIKIYLLVHTLRKCKNISISKNIFIKNNIIYAYTYISLSLIIE